MPNVFEIRVMEIALSLRFFYREKEFSEKEVKKGSNKNLQYYLCLNKTFMGKKGNNMR